MAYACGGGALLRSTELDEARHSSGGPAQYQEEEEEQIFLSSQRTPSFYEREGCVIMFEYQYDDSVRIQHEVHSSSTTVEEVERARTRNKQKLVPGTFDIEPQCPNNVLDRVYDQITGE